MRSAARILHPSYPTLPLQFRWTAPTGSHPLPHRHLRTTQPGRRQKAVLTDGGLPMSLLAPLGHPFDFTAAMRRLCIDVAARCPDLYHVNVDRILLGATQARSPRKHGLQAKITPLRFRDGALYRRRGTRTYQVQRYWYDGLEMLYVLTFCLPRFLDQSFDEKFVTVFHELYHVAPEFNGDLRRHHGRYKIHTHSQKGYDRHMADLARQYLSTGPDPLLHQFLRYNFRQLQAMHGAVAAQVVPAPKLVPIEV